MALALPTALAVLVAGSRPFVLAAALSLAASLALLARVREVGYSELSLCVFAGLAGAAVAWLVVDAEFFVRFQSSLRAATEGEGRRWVEWIARGGRLQGETRLLADELAAASAEWTARTWPAATFWLLWLGQGTALALAGRWSRRPTAVGWVPERSASLRLPDAWIWIFLAGAVGSLLAPRDTAAQEASLNVALIAAALYACQGFAVTLYYLEWRGVRRFARSLGLLALLLLLPIPVLVFALCLGLADVRFDFRSRGRSEPGAAGGG